MMATDTTTDAEDLMRRYVNVMDDLDALAVARESIEAELFKYLDERKATELAAAGRTVVMDISMETDHNALLPILEADSVTPEELEELGAWIPPHYEEVPGKFNLTKLKPLGKRGTDVQGPIDKSRVPTGRQRLVLKKKR